MYLKSPCLSCRISTTCNIQQALSTYTISKTTRLCFTMCLFMQKSSVLAMAELLLVVCATVLLFTGTTQGAALPGGDDDRYAEKEYQSSSPGAHELATWLIAQLRQSSNQAAATSTVGGCRYGPTVKRNSEIINSLLRLPQIDNGRK